MRLALRFILPLLAILALIAYAAIPLFDSLNLRWAVRDLDSRAQIIASTLADDPRVNSAAFLARTVQDERLFAIAICDSNGKVSVRTLGIPSNMDCSQYPPGRGRIWDSPHGSLHVARIGDLLLLHDMSFSHRRSSDTKRYLFYLFIILGIVISALTVTIAQLSWRSLLRGVRRALKSTRLRKFSWNAPELQPLAKDLRLFMREMGADRTARDESQISWTPKALKEILKTELAGDEVITVSNREPYIHVWKNEKVEVQFPASGLVTALEPVMRACSGTWIAHGSGSADRSVVDKNDHVQVPPSNPQYQIRRVWLSQEQEQGYYYGFSNEGLWPLCHMAYTRPIFRASDWDHYVAVNRRFADAVIEEARTEDPVILVQDYHFALLPRMIRERLPNATVITFWHIPWPNAEAFGICPWRKEIVDGLLGSSILGFHTRFHCNNFIETVDRMLEARIDRETSTISYLSQLTAIKSYPISIEWPVQESSAAVPRPDDLPMGISIGVGVDRMDYTKGIVERFYAVERFFEMHPNWIGKFSFVQIAAPSRSSIETYSNFQQQVQSEADRINVRFASPGLAPAIILKMQYHSPQQVNAYFRAADVCMVTSLHDGMNLVAKEFVASRGDERGVLILSQFTGAARELQEALIVNPYDIEQCATSIHSALTMPANEQRERMRSMRGLIQEFNVYRWAGRMLIDAARIRRQNRFRERITEPF